MQRTVELTLIALIAYFMEKGVISKHYFWKVFEVQEIEKNINFEKLSLF